MSAGKQKRKADAKTIIVRIIAVALAFLMLMSVAWLAIDLILHAKAAGEADGGYAFATSVSDRSYHVAVAVRWGSSVTVSHEIVSPFGFVIGESLISRTERAFTPYWETDETDIFAAADVNLRVGYKSCFPASSDADTDIGAYHVKLKLGENALQPSSPETPGGDGTEPPETTAPGTVTEPAVRGIWDFLDDMSGLFLETYAQVFPALIDGEKVIEIGAFPDYASATAAAAAVGAVLDGFDISVASPSYNGLFILNEDCDTVLFKYSGGENCNGAVRARQIEGADRSYLCFAANGYLYDGAFCFRRYTSSGTDGLVLINLVPLLEYCEGVVAGEVFVSWPNEALKAFAVTVNSFTTRNRNRRFNTYGCDLLASAVDQNYVGRNNVNDNVITACEAAEGQILVSRNKTTGEATIVDAAYSSSQGGCSVASKYVWGGEIGPYIISQPTPWERYSEVGWGLWFFEVSPSELAATVKNYKWSLLSGNRVESVSYETTGDSTYLKSITFTDNYGVSGTVSLSSNVSSAMGSYAHSANFVIGRNSVEYTYDNVISTEIIDLSEGYAGNLSVKTNEGIFPSAASLFSFFSSLGTALKDDSPSLYVKTADGTAILSGEADIPITTAPDENGFYTYVADYGTFLIVSRLQQYTKTLTAGTQGNFVIAGKGFGHGVGMSQYGVAHLARAGAKYTHILFAYYPGTELSDFYDFLG